MYVNTVRSHSKCWQSVRGKVRPAIACCFGASPFPGPSPGPCLTVCLYHFPNPGLLLRYDGGNSPHHVHICLSVYCPPSCVIVVVEGNVPSPGGGILSVVNHKGLGIVVDLPCSPVEVARNKIQNIVISVKSQNLTSKSYSYLNMFSKR